ncbi:MAG: hypothetical protein K8E66_01570, partial [Phycisphaerales bacterium]|nr:hypothetical protein [Phycisphaerales bacterium]
MKRVRRTPKFRTEVIGDATLYLGDCVEVSEIVSRVDAVITDPPFEMEAHTHQRRVHGGVHNAPLDFAPVTDEQRSALPAWAARNCSGWLLVFCQAEGLHLWCAEFIRAGCDYKRAMCWVKPDGMPQWSGDRPGMGYETIAAAWC